MPLIKPLPIKVGLYYGNDFRNFNTTITNKVQDWSLIYNVHLGKANITLFNYILSNFFEKVIPVQHLQIGYKNINNFDIILEPTVDSVDIGRGEAVYISYIIKLYLTDGSMINWKIEGEVGNFYSAVGPAAASAKNVNKNAQIALRAVAAKFIAGFCELEDNKKLFYNQCNQ